MNNNELLLLDCTLRDGGYINDWNWGYKTARNIVSSLSYANIDIVEVGFLRNEVVYSKDRVVCGSIEELNRLIPKTKGETIYSAMVMCNNYSVDRLDPYKGDGIELIRITAHEYDIENIFCYASQVQEKGYKVSINPINIMGYSDEKILWILDQVNTIQPYQFAVVDTFGSMKRRDLDRIMNIVDHKLSKKIRVALHLHENMSLGCCLAQRFLDYHLNRPITVDASLMGMGRTPGNLPLELIADYLNDYCEKSYDLDSIMDIIYDYISPLRGTCKWGYTPAYFLSAKYNLHRNYAEYYLEKGNLTNRDIGIIFSKIDHNKKNAFDADYAEELYIKYKSNDIDDTNDRKELSKILNNNEILLLAPGATITSQKTLIIEYIKKKNPIVVSLNFIPEYYKVDYAFFSNNKRLNRREKSLVCKIIVSSNLNVDDCDFVLNYNSLKEVQCDGDNCLVLFLKFLCDIGVSRACVAGADGYHGENDYYDPSVCASGQRMEDYNKIISRAIDCMNISIKFLTNSEYVK